MYSTKTATRIASSGKMAFCRVVRRALKFYTIVLLIKSCIHMHGINESIHWPNIWNLFTLIINVIRNMLLLMKNKRPGQWFSRFFNNIIIYGLSKYKDVFTNMLALCCKSLANNTVHLRVLNKIACSKANALSPYHIIK